MTTEPDLPLTILHPEPLDNGTLLIAFSGWMDGGEVSTGTVERLVDELNPKPVAQIDPEPFYIYNFPGSMEVTAMFRPHIKIEDGQVTMVEMPSNIFYFAPEPNLLIFVGKEPHLGWQLYAECIFHIARTYQIQRIMFVGSFGGSVPHTREPRMYVTASTPALVEEMVKYRVRKSDYEGPGSFTTFLMSMAPSEGLEMVSLVAEIPGYLQGVNPLSIAAVTRRLAKILDISVDLDSLREAGTRWELNVSSAVEEDESLAETVRKLESEYDDELLQDDAPGA